MMPSTTVEWRLEVEWDRVTFTGSFERHKSQAAARRALHDWITNDPPARWRIYQETITRDRIEESGLWPDEP